VRDLRVEWHWVPSRTRRLKAAARNLAYPREHFKSDADFFFFTHLDPVQRFWHVLGFLLSFLFFPTSIAAFIHHSVTRGIALWATGVFCFYGFGFISHRLYDGGTGATRPRLFLTSIPWALRLNWLTLRTSHFRRQLVEFAARYPFTVSAWEMRSKDV